MKKMKPVKLYAVLRKQEFVAAEFGELWSTSFLFWEKKYAELHKQEQALPSRWRIARVEIVEVKKK